MQPKICIYKSKQRHESVLKLYIKICEQFKMKSNSYNTFQVDMKTKLGEA